MQKLNLMHLHRHKFILQLYRLVMSNEILINSDVKVTKSLKVENIGVLPFETPEHGEWRRVLRTSCL